MVVATAADELVSALAEGGHSVQRIGDAVRITIAGGEGVDEVIDRVRREGCGVQSVIPRKESLEDLVVRMTREAQ
jgi:hypothetical protein